MGDNFKIIRSNLKMNAKNVGPIPQFSNKKKHC